MEKKLNHIKVYDEIQRSIGGKSNISIYVYKKYSKKTEVEKFDFSIDGAISATTLYNFTMEDIRVEYISLGIEYEREDNKMPGAIDIFSCYPYKNAA